MHDGGTWGCICEGAAASQVMEEHMICGIRTNTCLKQTQTHIKSVYIDTATGRPITYNPTFSMHYCHAIVSMQVNNVLDRVQAS